MREAEAIGGVVRLTWVSCRVGGVRLHKMASGDYITVTELRPWVIPIFRDAIDTEVPRYRCETLIIVAWLLVAL